MAKNKFLEEKAKERIVEQMHDLGEITVEKIVDLIRPHFLFDPQSAKEQLIRRKANQLMATMQDKHGIRTFFAVAKKEPVYINVECCKSSEDLAAVEKQLISKYEGLNASIKKVRYRQQEISGQMMVDEYLLEKHDDS